MKLIVVLAFIGGLVVAGSYAGARVALGKVIGPDPPLGDRSWVFPFKGVEALPDTPRAWVFSFGTNKLIKEGAKLIDCIDDVMEALGYIGMGLKTHADSAAKSAEEKLRTPLFDISRLNLSEPELAVYNALDREPLNIEDIIAHTSLSAGKVNSSLISLRLKGLIKQLPGNMFKK